MRNVTVVFVSYTAANVTVGIANIVICVFFRSDSSVSATVADFIAIAGP